MECLIRKTDDELQIVYGEVYAPNVPDVHGEFMTPVEVRKMAHLFMTKQILDQCDTNHDNALNGSIVVESFIAREDDSIYIPEAWVIGMHVPDDEMWQQIKSGEINGFSMEAFVHMREKVIEIEVPDVLGGVTVEADGHSHRWEYRPSRVGPVQRSEVHRGGCGEIRGVADRDQSLVLASGGVLF